MQVLGFGTYDAQRHPRIAVLLTGLQRRGVDVSEVNAPLGFSTAERVEMARRTQLAHRFAVRLARRWLTLIRQGRRVARSGRLDAVLIGYLGHFDVVLARVLFPRTTIALDHLIFAADTALDRGVSGGVKLWLLRRIDAVALRCADLILLDTEEHTALVPPRHRSKIVVAAVGAPYEWFVVQDGGSGTAGILTVVFFGLFTPLQGAPVIARAIAALPADAPIRFSMLGSGQDLPEAREIVGDDPRVIWRDWVDATDLPQEVAAHDVCLGIFSDTAKGLRVVPNKVYQGAAAGCAIITSDTGPQRRALGDAALLVPPNDPDSLAAALLALAADPQSLATRRHQARELANASFRPERVVQPLLEALSGTANGPRPVR